MTINSYEISKFYYTSYFLTCEQFSKWPSSPICLGINTFVACRKSHVWAQLARKRDEGRGASTRRERNSSVVNGALVKVARSITAITRREPARIRTMLYWRDSLIDTFLLFPGDLPPAIPFFPSPRKTGRRARHLQRFYFSSFLRLLFSRSRFSRACIRTVPDVHPRVTDAYIIFRFL